EVLYEGDALLQRLDDLLVVEAIRRRLLHGPAVGDRNPSPLPTELREVRLFAGGAGAIALLADGESVRQQPIQDLPLLGIEARAQRRLVLLGREGLVARQRLLGLQRIVRQELRGRVDGGETSADDDRGQLDLQIGEGLFLERAGELERHQKVRALAPPRDVFFLLGNDRRAPGARGDRDVIEARRERLLGVESAAEAH